jgi:hypothetical protein
LPFKLAGHDRLEMIQFVISVEISKMTQEAVAKLVAKGAFTFTTVALLIGIQVAMPTNAAADEGGVSFSVPGTFGSLAATPQQPGWSFAGILSHVRVGRWRYRCRASGYDWKA